jgi:cytochrome c peroxidase
VAVSWAGPEYFPAVGGSGKQTVAIRLIGLGTKETVCRAKLGFRNLADETVGETREVELRIGQAERHALPLSTLGITDNDRAEIRAVIELEAPLSVCWPAVEVSGPYGVSGYLSGTALRMKRPADAKVSPFLDAGEGQAVRVVVYRVSGEEAPPCELKAGFRMLGGTSEGEEQIWTLAHGEGISMDYSPAGQERVLIDLRPVKEGAGRGCIASAQLFERKTGATLKVVPIALPQTPEGLLLPAPPDTPEEPQPEEPPTAARPVGQIVEIQSPFGLPPLRIPDDNPPTAETIALGRKLFYDTILSLDGTIACASCHDPAAGFSDPRRLSLGVNGAEGERNSMSVLNAAFSPEVFWEGRSLGLEAQARMPVTGGKEFAHSLEGVERRLNSDPSYTRLFEEAWGPGPITYDMAAKSLATFQRTLLSGNSPVDRFLFGGDRNALNEPAQRALGGFQAICSQCHMMESTRWATFGNERFFNTGVAAVGYNSLIDQGRWKVTGQEFDRGAFRPPSLRNIELTAPYMHDGSSPTIADVALFYSAGGRDNAWLSPILRSIGPAPPGVTPDFEGIASFVRALTGEMPENAGPPEQ